VSQNLELQIILTDDRSAAPSTSSLDGRTCRHRPPTMRIAFAMLKQLVVGVIVADFLIRSFLCNFSNNFSKILYVHIVISLEKIVRDSDCVCTSNGRACGSSQCRPCPVRVGCADESGRVRTARDPRSKSVLCSFTRAKNFHRQL
jgi:hypothetical protein